jgi:conjugal transfer pilus assembly protein TraK
MIAKSWLRPVFVLCLSLTLARAWASGGEVELPPVPVSVMDQRARALTSHEPAPVAPTELQVVPGVNELVPVAIGHLNRLVTPFEQPRVRTTSDAQTQVQGNVVYVATDQEVPVSLYITPSDREQPALSLTLVPRRIPPREVTLRLDAAAMPPPVLVNRPAAAWESSQPYVDSLRVLLRTLALNQLPQGYDIRRLRPGEAGEYCQQTGVRFDFSEGQLLNGHYFSVLVGRAFTTEDSPTALAETGCRAAHLAAVAFWPRALLAAEEQTEVMLVFRNHREEPVLSRRPSLLAGGAL